MSRIFRQLKWALGSQRIAPRLYQQAAPVQHVLGDQKVILHKVRIREKSDSRGRIIRFLVVSTVLYGGLQILGSAAEKILDDIPEATKGKVAAQREEEEDAFFPFPLSTKLVHQPPYAGSDPEWQEFVRVAKDKQWQESIRNGLAQATLQSARTSRNLVAKCGADMKIRRYWMDMDYPYHPPPEYVMSGLLFTEDAIMWATKKVDTQTARLMERVFWPQPVAMTFWALGVAEVKSRTVQIARYLGFEVGAGGAQPNPGSPVPPLPTTHNTQIQKAVDTLRQQATKRPDQVSDPSNMAMAPKPPSATSNAPAEGQEPAKRFWAVDKVRAGMSESPWESFKKTLGKTWTPIKSVPPRGSIAVSGLVEIESSKAWVVIDVFAWYDPKAKAFDMNSTMMRLRRVQFKLQAPMR
ncbi:hypothetical protein OQA88_11811 [Cercophora sp. LCS_1]